MHTQITGVSTAGFTDRSNTICLCVTWLFNLSTRYMTHAFVYVWHDALTYLYASCDMTHPSVHLRRDSSRICIRKYQVFQRLALLGKEMSLCVTWLLHLFFVCDMTHSSVNTNVTYIKNRCFNGWVYWSQQGVISTHDMTHPAVCVWHESSICVTWIIQT